MSDGVNTAPPPAGRSRVRLALLASVAAGASLALAAELIFLAARGSPAETNAAFPVVAVVVGAAGLVVAAVLARNESSVRRHSEQVHLIGDPAIDTLEDEAMLATLAARLRDVLHADQVVVLLEAEPPDDQHAGTRPRASLDFEVVATAGTGLGDSTLVAATDYPANASAGVQTPPPPPPQAWADARTALTRPVTGEGAVAGMVYVGWARARTVRPDDDDLVDLAAGRVWSVVHRRRLVDAERRARLGVEGARRQLAVLANSGPALGSALNDYDDQIDALVDVCVPAFADLCAIDLIDDAGSLQPAAHRAHPTGNLQVPHGEQWRNLLARAMEDGHTRFGFLGDRGDEVADEVVTLLGASSALVVPVQAGGLSLGTITMATGPGRRGFRTSDVSVAEDVAGRLGVAIQRVLLHREAVASAEAQARTARRLRRLTDAAITLAGTSDPEQLLATAAAEVRRVLHGSAALVVHTPPDQPELRVRSGGPGEDDQDGDDMRGGEPSKDLLEAAADGAAAAGTIGWRDGCLAAPLIDRHQVCCGALAVTPRPGATFDTDDEVALVSLAHLVALVVGQVELTGEVAVREARMHALVDAAPLAILRLSPEGQVLEGNPAACQLFAWPAGAETGSLPEGLTEELRGLTIRAAKGEAIRDAELQGSGPGEPLDLVATVAPVRDDMGRIDAVLLVVADVSERRRVERQLQLAQRLESMGQVAGGVAHDFNNLLTVIIGYTEALLAATDDDDPTRPLLESIDKAGTSAAALTQQLLGLAGRRAAQSLAVVLGELVGGLEPVMRRLVGVDVELVVDVATAGAVVADPVALEQMVLNLVLNARDAMPDGGRLEVSVSPVELGPVEAEEHRVEPGRYVQLSVCDTGTGMDAETLARCFEPFFTRKERGRGTGLGLAGVYALATEGGGAVDVSSREGEGTTFRVHLPRTEEAAPVAHEAADERRPVGSGRVLLVEDEREIRQLGRQALEESGFTVVAAANAAAAIAAFEQASAPFDVLVTDIVMPGMRGTELAGVLLERQPSLEVLYVSGYAGVGPQAGDHIDGVEVLRKPFRSHDLCRRVVQLADRAR